ncbi:MAG: alpha/beta hydrolase [Bacteroidota bacterium]
MKKLKKILLYMFGIILGLIIIFMLYLKYSGKMDMYTPDAKMSEKIMASGQPQPIFEDYEVDGRNIHYAQVGDDPEKPTVIFLHGSPGALDAYMIYLTDTALAAKANLISVDRPGFGQSGFGTSEPSVGAQSMALKPLVEKVQGQKVILVGHSMGGPVIARMGMDYPELLDGLVMVAPSISPELEPANWWRYIVDFFLIRWLLPESMKVSNQEILPLKSELEHMLPMWENINVPVTVVQAVDDRLVPKGNADFAKKMLVNSPRVKLEIRPSGDHFILWSDQAIITEAIEEMLE